MKVRNNKYNRRIIGGKQNDNKTKTNNQPVKRRNERG